MSDIFPITDGLEIMGPLKTEGPTSIYKGRRSDNKISAVKLLPIPVLLGRTGEHQLKYIEGELSKLKNLAKTPHSNVVKIFDAGISKAANCFYIDMELMEGPDLEKLLQAANSSIFTIKETLRVAEHLCNGLEHCHRMKIKHGDIKTANIKWDQRTGNYLMVDFGSAVLPGQRRSGSVSSGSLDILAPEQYENKVLYQTDIYKLGLIFFRLLAGSFPSTASNNLTNPQAPVKTPEALPDLVSLRRNNIPSTWTQIEKQREIIIPEWLVTMVYKCLDANPEKRFENGMKLREYFTLKAETGKAQPEERTEESNEWWIENQKLLKEKEELQAALQKQEFNDQIMYRQWKEVNELVSSKERELEELKQKLTRPALSVPALCTLVIAAMLVGATASYFLMPARNKNQVSVEPGSVSAMPDTMNHDIKNPARKSSLPAKPPIKKDSIKSGEKPAAGEKLSARELKKNGPDNSPSSAIRLPESSSAGNNANLGEYKVKSKAYFHDEPDENTRRNAFIIHWNNATLQALEEKQGFIYVVFTNHLGQTSKGWLNKSDLKRID